ncbi:hypothetical protein ABZ672_50370 [Streptomyces mirabilis]|uniref:hypothetical protein n=1 Tax=Streptomyces mirabilis TaxID=68239 RepID=UPI0033F746A5
MTGLDWGTVPAWASAFLTSGSLLLGFYILLRDRRKDERSEALKVICWSEYGFAGTPDDGMHVVHVWNTSDRPISHVAAFVDLRLDDFDGFERFGLAATVAPGEEITERVQRRLNHRKIFPKVVGFTDGDGAEWVRELDTRRLYRAPHPRRHYSAVVRRRVRAAKHRDWRVLFARTPSIRRRLRD